MGASVAADLDFGTRLPIGDVLRRIAAVWCVLLLASALASMAALGMLTSSLGIVWGCAWLVAFGLWWMCLMRPRLPPPLFVATTAVVALLAVVATGATGPDAAISNAWLQLTCVAAALTLPTIWARSTVLVVAGASAVIMVVLVQPLTWHTGLESLGQAFDAFAVGMVVLAGAQGLKDASRRYDVRQREAILAASAASSAQEFARLTHGAAFQLHDTAINTLGAIANGIDADSDESLRLRAARDLAVLDRLDSHVQAAAGYAWSVATDTLTEAINDRAAALGMDVTVQVPPAEPDGPHVMTAVTLEGLCHCVFTILGSAAERAPSASVTVIVAGNPARGKLTVVQHLDGPAPALPEAQFQDLRRRGQLSGVDVARAADGSAPSTVTLSWDQEHDSATSPESPGIIASTVPLMLTRMCAWLFSLYLVETLVVYANTGQILPMVTLVVAGLLSVWALRAAFHGVPVTAAVAGTLVAAIPVMTLAPAFAVNGCVVVGEVYWTANVGLITVVLVLLLAPGRLLLWAGVLLYLGCAAGVTIWMTFDLGCHDSGLSSTLLNAASIVVALMLRRFLRQRDDDAARWAQQTQLSQAHRATSEYFVRSGRAAANAVMAPSRTLLSAFAEETLNPHDDQARLQARREESYLRALAEVDPDMGALVAPVLELIAAAREAGVRIKLARVGQPQHELSVTQARAVQRVIAAAIAEQPPDSMVRLSVFSGPTGDEVTAVTDYPVHIPSSEDDGIHVHSERLESQTRLQLTW